MKANSATIRICVDCLMMLANGDGNPDRPADQPEPLSAIGDDGDITLGMVADEHSCDWGQRYAASRNPRDLMNGREECECEDFGFSWASCDGCGCNLGGDRYAATIWFD